MTSPGGRRRVTSDALRSRLLVFTEGKTEEQYIKHWERINHRHVTVEVDPNHADPFTLVKRASKAIKDDRAGARRGGRVEYNGGVWCVFDRDEHKKLPEAFEMARVNGVRIAFTNPCLELWFVLHFQDQTAWIHHHDAQACSQRYLGCTKNLSRAALEQLAEYHDKAVDRAQQMAARHVADGNSANHNPSSNMWELVQLIMKSA